MEAREKAKLILAAIVDSAGGSFAGKTRLYKAFYFAHLIHLRDHDRPLSDQSVVRMPQGPAVDQGTALLAEMSAAGMIRQTQRPNGPYVEEVFTLITIPPSLPPDERATIDRTVEWIGDRSARELSDLTHEHSNTWLETPNGVEMNLYADLLSRTEYDDLLQRQRDAEELFHGVLA
jgi:uncharacterized phage-associated protein